jgi:hypothetical protein
VYLSFSGASIPYGQTLKVYGKVLSSIETKNVSYTTTYYGAPSHHHQKTLNFENTMTFDWVASITAGVVVATGPSGVQTYWCSGTIQATAGAAYLNVYLSTY